MHSFHNVDSFQTPERILPEDILRSLGGHGINPLEPIEANQNSCCVVYRGEMQSGEAVLIKIYTPFQSSLGLIKVSDRAGRLREFYEREVSSLESVASRVHGLGIERNPFPELVEYFEIDSAEYGETFVTVIRPNPGTQISEMRLTEEDAVAVLRGGLEDLSILESCSITHKDICPRHILFDRGSGAVSIIDFDAGKHLFKTQHTFHESRFATYPPDALRTDSDCCSLDRYALGISVLSSVLGKDPWELPRAIFNGHECIDIGSKDLSVNSALRAYFSRLCSPEPNKRFSSNAECIAALEAVADTLGNPHTSFNVLSFGKVVPPLRVTVETKVTGENFSFGPFEATHHPQNGVGLVFPKNYMKAFYEGSRLIRQALSGSIESKRLLDQLFSEPFPGSELMSPPLRELLKSILKTSPTAQEEKMARNYSKRISKGITSRFLAAALKFSTGAAAMASAIFAKYTGDPMTGLDFIGYAFIFGIVSMIAYSVEDGSRRWFRYNMEEDPEIALLFQVGARLKARKMLESKDAKN